MGPEGQTGPDAGQTTAVRTIGRYRTFDELGRGAMGVVYRGFDPVIGRTVALKTLLLDSGDATAREFKERLYREAAAAGALSHPNIVTIFDIVEDGNTTAVAMEFIEGRSLASIIAERAPLSFDVALEIFDQICSALDYAGGAGIVHRDIKPANILITPAGRVKVTDFGVARLALSTMTQAGTILGSPSYMSPEQVRGLPLDGRSDLFSAAVVFYEMVTRERPFSGNDVATTMFRIAHEPPTPPGTFNKAIGPGVTAVLERAFAKSPNDRYANGAEFAAELRKAATAGARSLAAPSAVLPSVAAAPPPPVPLVVTPEPPRIAPLPVVTQAATQADQARPALQSTVSATAPSLLTPLPAVPTPASMAPLPGLPAASDIGEPPPEPPSLPALPPGASFTPAPVVAKGRAPVAKGRAPAASRGRRTIMIAGGAAALLLAAVAVSAIVWLQAPATLPLTTDLTPAMHPAAAARPAPEASAPGTTATPPTPAGTPAASSARGAAPPPRAPIKAPVRAPVVPVAAAAPPPPPTPAAQPAADPAPPARYIPAGRVFSATEVDERPTVLQQVAPVYPEEALAKRLQDVVVLKVLVTAGGRAGDVQVLRGSQKSPAFDGAAMAAARQYVFSPARKGGQAVPCWFNVGISFQPPR